MRVRLARGKERVWSNSVLRFVLSTLGVLIGYHNAAYLQCYLCSPLRRSNLSLIDDHSKRRVWCFFGIIVINLCFNSEHAHAI